MSASKTEAPTPKRLKDAARKGQTFKARDLVTVLVLLCGGAYLASAMSLRPIADLLAGILRKDYAVSPGAYAAEALRAWLVVSLPFVGLCIVAGAVPSLLLSRFQLATEALHPNLAALNPVTGFQKIFSLRTVKDAVKSVLYLGALAAAVPWYWRLHGAQILSLAQVSQASGMFALWAGLGWSLLGLLVACALPVAALDALAEYFLFRRDQKMDKQEVTRELKDQHGSPEIKSRRREIHLEILEERIRADIRQSRLVIANPTHIAIGIYFRPDIVPLPFVSVVETNQRARAVLAYAREVGVPVIRNVALARRLFPTVQRYSFVMSGELDEVLRLIVWLEDVERACAGTPLSPPPSPLPAPPGRS